jgi:hypothetical protein
MFSEGIIILISTFCVCADGIQDLSKAFQFLPYTVINFLFASFNYLLILKMLPETLHSIPLSVISRCSLVPTSHWLLG